MRTKQILSTTFLALLGVTAIAQVAAASSAKDQYTGNIYVKGLTPSAQIQVSYIASNTKSATADSCGLVKVTVGDMSGSAARVSFNGGSPEDMNQYLPVTYGSITCSGGTVSGVPNGSVTKFRSVVPGTSNTILYLPGQTPFQQYDFVLSGVGATRKVVANACGVAKLSNTGKWKDPTSPMTVYLNGTAVEQIDPGTIASVAAPPVCKNNVLLLPPGFPN